MNLQTISNDVLVIILKMLPIDTLLASRLTCSTICNAVDSIQFDDFVKETHESNEERIEVTYKIGPIVRCRTITSISIHELPHNNGFNYYGGVKKAGEYTVLKLVTVTGMIGRYLYMKGSTVKHIIIIWGRHIVNVVSNDSYIDVWTFLLRYRVTSIFPMKHQLRFNHLLEEKIGKLQLPKELYTTVLGYLD